MAAFRGVLRLGSSNHKFCISLCMPSMSATLNQEPKPLLCHQPVRFATNKHWNPKFRRFRWAKRRRLEGGLPDYDKIRLQSQMDPSEQRAEMKKKGMQPGRQFMERELFLACSGGVFDSYVPPEGDGLASTLSVERAKQSATKVTQTGKDLNARRKIRQYDEEFSVKTFPSQAQEIYLESLEKMNDVKANKSRLHELVTEYAFPEMTWQLRKKTVRWKFIGSLEAPRVVHLRIVPLQKGVEFAQVTVRFHTQQILAIYDRFGRLMYGGESLIKDCLEFVVFEKNLAEEYSEWRVHAKITPDWLTPPGTVVRSLRKPVMEDLSSVENKAKEDEEKKGDESYFRKRFTPKKLNFLKN